MISLLRMYRLFYTNPTSTLVYIASFGRFRGLARLLLYYSFTCYHFLLHFTWLINRSREEAPIPVTMASSIFRLSVIVPRVARRGLLGGNYVASVRKFPDFSIFSRLMATQKAMVTVTFVKEDGTRLTGQGKEGDSLLDVVVNNDLDLDGFGACEGTLACSTCHLILKKEDFEKLPDRPSDEELDMLDLAYGLCETSRLGCQIVLEKWMDGMEVIVPGATMDARER